ncbi:MAG: NADH-quinone oxidoreductase subunit M [Solirubrobacterales bacterium]|nr:NADH-quinone oxidoreductase subunit M [Solirubrobacterales bacterium]
MLNVILWLPLAAGVLALVAPRATVRWTVLAGALGTLVLAVVLAFDFTVGDAALQHAVDESWIPDLGVRYQLGVDGISLFLVVLTALLWEGAVAFSALRGYPEDGRVRLYYFLLALAETAALGAFLAQDLLLFVLFFDLMLVPFFFLIGAFGNGERIVATTKMIVYTLVGSLLMLVGAIAVAILVSQQTGELSFSMQTLSENLLSTGNQTWIFCFFAAAFLVKMPAFPIHGWMPDAYRAAPIPVLVLLSGVLAKVGAYGFLRVALPIFPDATADLQELVLVIGVASILYGSVMAFTQNDTRLVAGYSSVAQLGFITIGIFSLRPEGANGAVLQMVNHGLVVAGIFLIIAVLWARTGTDDLRRMGGQALRAPVLAALFLVVTLATLAMPGSANFIGEFYILNGVFQSKIVFAFVAATGVAMAAFYALRLYQRTMHNRLPEGATSREISLRDGVVLAPLVAVIVGLALYPGLILDRGEASVAGKIEAVAMADCADESFARSDGGRYVLAFGACADDRYGINDELEEQIRNRLDDTPGGGRWTGYGPVVTTDPLVELSTRGAFSPHSDDNSSAPSLPSPFPR